MKWKEKSCNECQVGVLQLGVAATRRGREKRRETYMRAAIFVLKIIQESLRGLCIKLLPIECSVVYAARKANHQRVYIEEFRNIVIYVVAWTKLTI